MAGLLGVLPADPEPCPNPECQEGHILPGGNCGFDDPGALLDIACLICTEGVVAPRSLDGARTPLVTTADLPTHEQIPDGWWLASDAGLPGDGPPEHEVSYTLSRVGDAPFMFVERFPLHLSSVVGSVVLTGPYPIVDGTTTLLMQQRFRSLPSGSQALVVDTCSLNLWRKLGTDWLRQVELPGAAFLGDPEGLVGRWAYLARDPQPPTCQPESCPTCTSPPPDHYPDRRGRCSDPWHGPSLAPFPVEHTHPAGTLTDIDL
jgi:hypothetical protein